jgi:hypothetical protein
MDGRPPLAYRASMTQKNDDRDRGGDPGLIPPDPGPARQGDGQEEIVPIETRWVRQRLRQAAEGFPAAGEDGDRLRAAVERLDETAAALREEIRQKAAYQAIASITSAVIGIAAFVVAASVPRLQLAGVAIAILELGSVFIFRNLQKRLARDLLVVAALEGRYRRDAGTADPGESGRLAGKIRAELETALGGPLPAAGPGPGR